VLQQCVELVMTSGVARISEWGWGLAGSRGGTPTSEAIGGLGASPTEARGSGNGAPALGDFYNFLIKITYFYAYIGQKVILKQ